jgi:outer membrane protein assembly complex protein YaeT
MPILGVLLVLGSLSTSLQAGEKKDISIKEIKIRGAKGREEAVISQMRIQKGKNYTAAELQRLLHRDVDHLFRWGIFVRRILPAEPKGDTVLILEVEERLRIASIKFVDMDAFEEDEVLPLLLVKRGSPTDEALLQVTADQLEAYYKDQGYRFATVKFSLKRLSHGRAHLIFKIWEGPRTRIVDIFFHGNRSIRSGRLRSRMQTERSDIFQAERLEEEKFRRDLAALEQYYREEGWRDATVTLEDLVYSDDRERLTIIIRVVEGERYVVTSLEITGNKEIGTPTLLRKVKLRKGMYYRAGMIYGDISHEEKGDFERIRELYGDKGYLRTMVTADEIFDEKTKSVKVIYTIREGDKIRVRRVLIRGNEKTRDDVIRRYLAIQPGGILKRSELKWSHKRLLQTQYFSKINVNFEDTGIPDEKDVLVEVEEMRTGDIRFIAAYNQSTQFMGRIAVRFKNFDISRLPTSISDLFSGRAFAGGGQTLTIQLTAGMEKQVIYNLRFDEPYLFGTRTSFSLYLARYQRDWGPYLERRLQAHFSFGRRLFPFLSANLKYRVETVELRDISTYAPPDVFTARGPDTISALIGQLTLDLAERDPFGQPYSGLDAYVKYEYAGGFLRGTLDFHKAEASAKAYTTVFGHVSEWRHILKLQVQMGWSAPHHHADQVPIYERFYLGGLGTVRGFAFRSVGPHYNGEPIGGSFRVVGTLEYSLPLYRAPMPQTWQQEIDVLRMVFFYDVGMLSPDYRSYSSDLFRSGIGFGFRLRVPALGGIPIALDFGWPISRRPEDRTERVSFSLGFFFF